MLAPFLVSAATCSHKKNWRECPCSWCDKKREATLVIGSHVPRFMRGAYIDDVKHIWREDMRKKYRAYLKELEYA